jgi:predicted dehydrogenase
MAVKLGILGLAHVHAERYLSVLDGEANIEIAGIFHDESNVGRDTAQRFRTVYFDDLSAFLRAGMDGVIVCSETFRHKDHCLAAFQAGLHVLCEKPIATTLDDGTAMIEKAEKSGLVLKIAFTTRFSPAAARLRTLVRDGELGSILSLVGTNHGKNPGGWFVDPVEAGGGSLMDHIVHQLDYARWILGRDPVRVYAEMDTFFGDIPVEDAGLVHVEFEGGALLTIDASWSRPPEFPAWGDNIIEVNGTLGSALLDTQGHRAVLYSRGDVTARHVPWGENTSHGMIRDFISAVSGRESRGADGRDGLIALETVLAAYRSVGSGKTEKIAHPNQETQ